MNGIGYVEMPSRNFEKTITFYRELFGWKFDYMPEMKYMTFQAPEGPGGGFSTALKAAQTPGIIFYINVDDIESIVLKSGKVGGSCITTKTRISPEMGYYAVLGDPDGNHIGVWSKH
jgi:uncharacterized protein